MSVQTRIPTLHDIWQQDRRIVSVEALPQYVLRLVYRDGAAYEVDLSAFVGSGGLSDALSEPTVFAAVAVSENGTAVEWPNGVDIGSDTLRLDAELQLRGLTRADLPD